MNALMKLAKSSESGDGATMFVTHAPCLDCAKGVYQAGIKRLCYGEDYRDDAGVRFLKQCGIDVSKVD
jgi:dCMP deaminase